MNLGMQASLDRQTDRYRQQGLVCYIVRCVLTRCSAMAERLHCRVRYSFGQKWKTETGRQYFTDIIGLSSTTVI